MLYQENVPELDGGCLIINEQLTCFSKARERILGAVKVAEYPSVQGTQSSEEDVYVWERYPINTERLPVSKYNANVNHAPVG